MSNDITVTIVGTLTRDPEMKFLPSGAGVAEFAIAVNERKKKADGSWEDGDPSFFDCAVWNQMAENVVESLVKGNRVIVTGSMKQERWEKDGVKHSKVKIQVDAVGPDLRFATAKVEKNERREGTQQQAPSSKLPTDFG